MSSAVSRPTRADRRRAARLRRRGLDGDLFDVRRARLLLSRDPVILECGANSGTDTLVFLEQWPTARVTCFEPEPRAIEQWKETVTSPRATLVEVALAATDGTATFHRSSGRPPSAPDDLQEPWNQSGSIRRPTGHLEVWPWVRFEETITVETRSLDSWAAEHGVGDVDLIWADVQGAEGDLVQGGLRTLDRTRYLYIETTPATEWYEGEVTTDELLAMLPGWRVLAHFPDNVLIENGRFRRFGSRRIGARFPRRSRRAAAGA